MSNPFYEASGVGEYDGLEMDEHQQELLVLIDWPRETLTSSK